jgi:hypothetical protein
MPYRFLPKCGHAAAEPRLSPAGKLSFRKIKAPGGVIGLAHWGAKRGVCEWNKMRNISFIGRRILMEVEVRKLLAVATASLVIAGFTVDSASARHHHRHGRIGHGMTVGSSMRGSGGGNAELRGNNGNSASGSNSLANPNNATGPH